MVVPDYSSQWFNYCETSMRWGWIAGIIDGEGCLRIHRSPRKKYRDKFEPQLILKMTHSETIEEISVTFGEAHWFVRYAKPRRSETHRFCVSNDYALETIRHLEPLLITKSNEARMILAFSTARYHNNDDISWWLSLRYYYAVRLLKSANWCVEAKREKLLRLYLKPMANLVKYNRMVLIEQFPVFHFERQWLQMDAMLGDFVKSLPPPPPHGLQYHRNRAAELARIVKPLHRGGRNGTLVAVPPPTDPYDHAL